jgi:hypothetical protein
MQFQPKAEDEVKRAFAPIPKGTYDFEVLEASDEVSAKGNDMIKVNIAIWQGDKVLCRVFDYLLPSMEAKLRHACDACGLLDRYQSGSLQAVDFIGRAGKVRIKIKKETDQYPAKNEVEDYVCRPAKSLGSQTKDAPPLTDDDCPF